MISQLSLGLTALRASQFGLSVAGQNIANASTPGYHRQLAHLVNRRPISFGNLEFGTGVEVSQIRRMQFQIIESAITENNTAQATFDVQLDISLQFETLLTAEPGSISSTIDTLFNRLEELSAQPHDATVRNTVILSAQDVVRSLRSLTSDLDRLTQNIDAEVRASVSTVNDLTRQVIELNREIKQAKAAGIQPNNLLDRRDAIVNELAGYLDVQVDVNDDSVLLADGLILAGQGTPRDMEVYQDETGLHLRLVGSSEDLTLRGGKLDGLLTLRNETIPGLHERLNEVARGLFAAIDPQHALGVGISGLHTRLTTQRPLTDVTVPLNQASTALPITAGTLTVSLVNEQTSERTLHQLAIDPASDTLQDLADRLSAIDHLQAIVNPVTGELTILAEQGYGFDFTGLPATHPDTSGLTGTAVPTMGGMYNGDANEQLQFVFRGSGDVGVTDGLQLEVQDSNGNFLQLVDVGAGYEAGQPIELSNGLTVQLTAGSVVAAESFATPAVATADTSGVLAALGLNTFFSGTDARTISVSSRLLNDSNALATSVTGDPGDTTNLSAIVARRRLSVDSTGTLSVEQYTAQFIADVGTHVSRTVTAVEGLTLLGENLAEQHAAISGVDTNEEAVRMFEYQRAFEAAARYLSVIDETTQELLTILR